MGLYRRRVERLFRRAPGIVLEVARFAALNMRRACPNALLDILHGEATRFRHLRGNHPVYIVTSKEKPLKWSMARRTKRP